MIDQTKANEEKFFAGTLGDSSFEESMEWIERIERQTKKEAEK